MKTSELTGAALDWTVAKCEGYECQFDDEVSGPWLTPEAGYLHDEKPLSKFHPSTDWSIGGPIIEREVDNIYKDCDGVWFAIRCGKNGAINAHQHGPTPLIAAMRCYCASRLGDEVDVPEELK